MTLEDWLATHCEGCEKPTPPSTLRHTRGYCRLCDSEHTITLAGEKAVAVKHISIYYGLAEHGHAHCIPVNNQTTGMVYVTQAEPGIFDLKCSACGLDLIKEPNRLTPVKGLRAFTPHVCATCKTGEFDGDGGFHCLRPGGPTFATGTGKHWLTTCYSWQKRKEV
jgi:hypothetical protein